VQTGIWWTSTVPGLFILAAVLAAVLIGGGLRERFR
jgi:ABC-type dipeptide/oligopeptide/nickel transport system permease subunit